jgi:hypothetical protein
VTLAFPVFVLAGCNVALKDDPEINNAQFQRIATACSLSKASQLEKNSALTPSVAVLLSKEDFADERRRECVHIEADKLGVLAPIVGRSS